MLALVHCVAPYWMRARATSMPIALVSVASPGSRDAGSRRRLALERLWPNHAPASAARIAAHMESGTKASSLPCAW